MNAWKYYHLAQDITDALQVLANAPDAVRLIAGGTDLLLDIQQGRHPPVHTLVDITHIPEMRALEVRQGKLYIGAAVPLSQIVSSSLIREHAEALVEATALIGGPQVRNTATLGGNVAHALPAADGTIALLALDAMAEIASLEGRRWVHLGQLFTGPGKSALDARRDLLVGFYLPLKQIGEGSAFSRVMRPQGVAIAILNMAAWIARQEDTIVNVRIALGPAGPIPVRACKTEDYLKGQKFAERVIEDALEILLKEVRFRTSPHRASAGYRQYLAGVLLKGVLLTAWKRSKVSETPKSVEQISGNLYQSSSL